MSSLYSLVKVFLLFPFYSYMNILLEITLSLVPNAKYACFSLTRLSLCC